MASSSSASSSASFPTDSAGWSTWTTDGTVAFGAEFDVAVIGSGLAGLSAAHRVRYVDAAVFVSRRRQNQQGWQ